MSTCGAPAQGGDVVVAPGATVVDGVVVHGGAPVVPVAILGTRRTGESTHGLPGLRRDLVVEFGEPIDVGLAGVSRRVAIDHAAGAVRDAMSALLASAQERTGVELPADDPRSTA